MPRNKAKVRAIPTTEVLAGLRKWIPCEEFCELYHLPMQRPPRKKAAQYKTSRLTACRKCCVRLAEKGLITTKEIGGRLYVARESVLDFGGHK